MAEVVLADPESAGLPAMLAALLSAAVADPAKARILDAMSGTVTITVPDADVTVGLRFAGGTCRVQEGPVPGAAVSIEMPSDTLLEFSSIPLLLGMPSVLTPEGRAFTRQLLTRQVKIGGLRHVVLVTQLNRLLSVA